VHVLYQQKVNRLIALPDKEQRVRAPVLNPIEVQVNIHNGLVLPIKHLSWDIFVLFKTTVERRSVKFFLFRNITYFIKSKMIQIPNLSMVGTN